MNWAAMGDLCLRCKPSVIQARQTRGAQALCQRESNAPASRTSVVSKPSLNPP
ncbi:hypothetical protein D3C81_871320 [compost metagenome]